MAAVLGLDLGTTTITALALDPANGDVLARATTPNRAESTSPADRARGRSEWDVGIIARAACNCLHETSRQLGPGAGELAGLGITGQQHGMVLVDDNLRPLTPLIGWQDRRGAELHAASGQSFVERAVDLVGQAAPQRTGCRLSAGYLAVTLFWLKETGALPASATACFLPDYFAARCTGARPVTDPTCAASGGVFDLRAGDWDGEPLAALGLARSLLPEVRPSGERLGRLLPEPASASGLPAGLPIFVGIGDNQASFLGAVANPAQSVLVNVGTGGQVAAWADTPHVDRLLEARPFPGRGYLLVCAGLCGGRSYAALETFFRQVGEQLLGVTPPARLYEAMNRLAAAVPAGSDGVTCAPFFTGTRHQPELRAGWAGLAPETFTPGHLARALLEGMAQAFHAGYDAIARQTGRAARQLVGAGNGLRENPLLAGIVAAQMQLPLQVPCHREEAAFGAALLAAVGAGCCPDLGAAGRLIRYGPST
jgi:sugar (pentulose or hexulose) kinase